MVGRKEKAAPLKKTVPFVAGSRINPLSKAAITLPELGNYRISVPAGRYTPGSLRQNAVNLGGISITVTAADTAAIQNPARLAELVSKKIFAEVEGIVAANG